MRITIIELVLAMTFASIILATMMLHMFVPYYFVLRTVCNAAVLSLFCILTISAFVQTGDRRAHAIGFLVPAIAYGCALFLFADSAFDPYAKSKLDSTRWLIGFHRSIERDFVIDLETGAEVEDFKKISLEQRAKMNWVFGKKPDDATFLQYGHLLILCLIGYIGSYVGRFLYRQDTKRR